MTDERAVVGTFRIVQGRCEWRVTSPSAEIATAVGAVFGGAAPRRGSACAWEIICSAVPLPVLVGVVEPQALMFQVTALADLGWFRLDFAPWDAADLLRAAEVADAGRVGGPPAAVLDLRPIYLTTLGGMIVRYTAATLAVA
jgi:hypothetical protein